MGRGGQTQGHMRTGRNSMKEDGKLSGQKLLMLLGRRSMRSGTRGPRRGFPSGLGRGQVRRRETLRVLRMMKKVLKRQQLGKIMRRKRKMRKNMKRKSK